MVDTPAKPKRRRWRWLVVVVVLFATTAVGVWLYERAETADRDRWISRLRAKGIHVDLIPVAHLEENRILRFILGWFDEQSVLIQVWDADDVPVVIDASGDAPRRTLVMPLIDLLPEDVERLVRAFPELANPSENYR